ncbi:hypothetical protein G6F68_020257 [Rhizopus microsporus]|nr:hypothetical protein G6F68_020257 [Rhizopus microsporus]
MASAFQRDDMPPMRLAMDIPRAISSPIGTGMARSISWRPDTCTSDDDSPHAVVDVRVFQSISAAPTPASLWVKSARSPAAIRPVKASSSRCAS